MELHLKGVPIIWNGLLGKLLDLFRGNVLSPMRGDMNILSGGNGFY